MVKGLEVAVVTNTVNANFLCVVEEDGWANEEFVANSV